MVAPSMLQNYQAILHGERVKRFVARIRCKQRRAIGMADHLARLRCLRHAIVNEAQLFPATLRSLQAAVTRDGKKIEPLPLTLRSAALHPGSPSRDGAKCRERKRMHIQQP
jgi:hypothetical protein